MDFGFLFGLMNVYRLENVWLLKFTDELSIFWILSYPLSWIIIHKPYRSLFILEIFAWLNHHTLQNTHFFCFHESSRRVIRTADSISISSLLVFRVSKVTKCNISLGLQEHFLTDGRKQWRLALKIW